jgi:hypothetical protein
MKILGLEGINDPQTLRAEVARGGRFVLYTYCISLLLISFKRASSIYFIRPGQSAVVRGLPFTLTSFFLGWWGFPWGLVYTIEALVKNLGGGTDVTQAVLADLAPEESPVTASVASGSSTPPPMPLRGDAPPPPPLRPASTEPRAAVGLGLFRLAALALAAGLVVWIGVAVHRGGNVQTALVNGLDTPLTLQLDDEAPQTIPPRSSTLLTLSEGEHRFSWTRPDGRAETDTFAFSSPFWTRPLHRSVAVLNPDRTAVVYHETTRYYPTDATIPEGENDVKMHAPLAFHVFPETDYFFEEFPREISLKNRAVTAKTRITHLVEVDPAQRLWLLSRNEKPDAVRSLALRLGDLLPDNESVLQSALGVLAPADYEAFFASHLDDRPVRLEWHRAYQHLIERTDPARDLLTHYRTIANQSPDDGNAAYLAARIEPDRAARLGYLRQAVAAKHPSAYGHHSLAFEALGETRFADALAHMRDAERAGLASLSFRHNQRDILLANGLLPEAAELCHRVSLQDPRPFSPTRRGFLQFELAIACRGQPEDATAEHTLVTPFLDSLKPHLSPDRLRAVADELAATAAYARGDETAFAQRLASDADSAFAVAITRGEPAPAALALAAQPRQTGQAWLLVYLAARAAHDQAAADSAFEKALVAFQSDSREHRAVAALLRSGEADPETICATLLPVDDKCVLTTALGFRFPRHRAAYHERARKLNFRPEFPSRFLDRQLAAPPSAPATAAL